MENKTEQTLKAIREELFKKGFLLKGFCDCGIKLYRIWDIDKAIIIKDLMSIKELRKAYKEVLKE